MSAASEHYVLAEKEAEAISFEAQLRFSVDPGALRVLVPEGSPASRQVPSLGADWHAARALRRWLRPLPATQKSRNDDTQIPVDQDIPGPRRPHETI